VKDLAGKIALERGPIVYAVEGIDNQVTLSDIELSDEVILEAKEYPDLLGGVTCIHGTLPHNREFMAIPYYAWSHRGVSPMAVWLPGD
jgi:DUF1680 family protein